MTARARFIARYGAGLPPGEVAFMACDLDLLIREARAIERRRLTSDPGWVAAFEAARALTRDEIDRHRVPREEHAR